MRFIFWGLFLVNCLQIISKRRVTKTSLPEPLVDETTSRFNSQRESKKQTAKRQTTAKQVQLCLLQAW